MSEFEKWFRSLNANGKTVYFLGNEHKVSEMAWNHQQAIIDDLKTQLNNMEQCYIQIKKINDEQSAIIHSHVAARIGLQKRVDVLSKRLNEAVSLVADDLEEAVRGEREKL